LVAAPATIAMAPKSSADGSAPERAPKRQRQRAAAPAGPVLRRPAARHPAQPNRKRIRAIAASSQDGGAAQQGAGAQPQPGAAPPNWQFYEGAAPDANAGAGAAPAPPPKGKGKGKGKGKRRERLYKHALKHWIMRSPGVSVLAAMLFFAFRLRCFLRRTDSFLSSGMKWSLSA